MMAKLKEILILFTVFGLDAMAETTVTPMANHYRAENGVVFPTAAPTPELQPLKEKIDGELKRQIDRAIAVAKPTMPKPETRPLFPCTKTSTQTDRIGERGSTEAFDFLFIEPKDVPPEAELVLGEGVTIFPYFQDSVTLATSMAAELGVNCLPTRLRLVDGIRYHHEGKAALKDYSEKKKTGELNPLMKELLEQ